MDDTVMQNSTCESNDQKEVMQFKRCEQKTYKNNTHMVGAFEVLQSFRKDKVLCDIRIETDDGVIIFGHKVVLMSVCTYFRDIFTGFNDSNIDHINVLLTAANLLQLDYVKNVCAEFLQTQLDASNCLGIKAFAELYDCVELLKCSQKYIKNQFLEVVNNDEFLTLTSVEVIKLISCNDILAPLEEKIFECVINWLKYDLDSRKDFLPELMEHVRLPLISKQFLLEKVVDEPLLKCSLKCKDYIIEALQFHLQPSTVSQTIRSTPRYSIGFHKVILMLCRSQYKSSVIYWNDNIWQQAPKMSKCYKYGVLSVINDQFVLAVGGDNLESKNQHVEMLDVSLKSSSWIPMMDMLVSRTFFGVGSLDNCVYAIGGRGREYCALNSVEVFDITTNKWQMVTSMSTKRSSPGVGVLKNLLYVVGGFDGKSFLNTVECYDPCLDTWTTVAAMSEYREDCGVGVLDGVLYAIGGRNKSLSLKSVEAYTPSSGVWTTIADMHFSRHDFGVVVSNGLIHVIGGRNRKYILNSIEIYNPKTNTWSLKTLSKNVGLVYSGVVVNRPPHFKTFDD